MSFVTVDLHLWMTGRDGSPWETCRVQTPSANCPISTAKSFGYQLSIPFMMPCGKAAPNPHRIQAAGAGVRGCHGASRDGCSSCRNLWRRACRGCSWDKSHCHCPAEKGPFLTLRAHYPPLPLIFCVWGMLCPVFCTCNRETISSVVLLWDASALGQLLPWEDGSNFKAEMTLCYINLSLGK